MPDFFPDACLGSYATAISVTDAQLYCAPSEFTETTKPILTQILFRDIFKGFIVNTLLLVVH